MGTRFFINEHNNDDLLTGADILFRDYISKYNLTVNVKKENTNTLRIEKDGEKCTVVYSKKTDFFRALSILFYNCSKEGFVKEENRSFDSLANMLDCSRNCVLKVESVKKIIRKMALLGMNTLMLYMEDTYEVKNHPYFGIYRGKYLETELKEIDDYADVFGIEAVPCIQTLAHLHNVLKWPGYEDIKDDRDILMVGSEKSYSFITDMISSATAPFRSNRIHIGMDEACGLGRGNYLTKNGYRNVSDIMKEHMDRVYDICIREGVKPMIWSDMYITANTGRNYYDIPSDIDTSKWMQPSQNLGLVYWDYYHHDKDKYRTNLLAHMAISDNVVFAGGSWTWSGVAPNLEKAEDATVKALSACKELGIKEVICTHWQDNGAETVVDAGFPIMSLFAAICFGGIASDSEPSETHRRCFGNSYDDCMLLSLFDHVDEQNIKNMRADTTAKFLLYQDPMIGIFDKQIENYSLTEHYKNLSEKLKTVIEKKEEGVELFNYYYCLAKVLQIKSRLGINVKKAYDERNLSELRHIATELIPACIDEVNRLRELRRDMWMKDSKAFGFELVDIRFGGVATRLSSAAYRIKEFLDGKVERLEELEEERLLYKKVEKGKNELCYAAHWQRIISGCDLDDTI